MSKILIIDDEPDNLEALVNILETMEEDHEVFQAFNGKTAVKITEDVQPDLIITDWEMPHMTGIEYITEVKKNPQLADIPVIMCTGVMTTSENLKTALDAGACDYIRKPVDPIELVARIQSMLKLADSYREIKQLNHAKDKLFSIIAHDLKNPFNALIGITEILLNDFSQLTDDEKQSYIKIINESSLNSYHLLENLLDWALNQLNKIEYSPSDINLYQMSVTTIEQLKLNLQEKNLTIVNEIPEESFCFADKDMIATVLRNIITNAIKYSFIGNNIHLSLSGNDRMITIAIKDFGTGMSEKRLQGLFSIEFSTSYPGTNNEKGSGLGLLICKEMIEKNNGTIRAESKKDEGSTFYITLPAS